MIAMAPSHQRPPLRVVEQPAEPWNTATARALIEACYRRVGAALLGVPAAQRWAIVERTHPAVEAAGVTMWAAFERQDLAGVRRAVLGYEQAAEPVFVACREARRAQQAPLWRDE